MISKRLKQQDIRSRSHRERLDVYRKWVHGLRTRYSELRIGAVSYAKLALRPKVEDAGEAQEPRHQRTVAAPSILQTQLANAFAGSFQKLPAVDITRRCHQCGALCRWDHARELRHQCEHCHAEWDQDENACRNLLADASGSATTDPPGSLAEPEIEHESQAAAE